MTNQLPSSFALWGAKFNSNQQSVVGWLIFSTTAYLYLHFIAVAGVEIAKWIQPFYEAVVAKRKLLKHPEIDETDWMDILSPDEKQDVEQFAKMAKKEAYLYVQKKLRYLYGLIYLQLIIEAVVPIIIGAFGLIKLASVIKNV